MKPRILLTGATGSVGTELLNQLSQNNKLDQVRILARKSNANEKKLKKYTNKLEIAWCDITDKEAVSKVCKGIDICIHLAGIIPPQSEIQKELSWKINVEGTRNIIEGLEKHSPKAFLMFSSSVVVYGDRVKNPEIRVNDPLATEKNDNYGKAKIECEKIIKNSSIKNTIWRLNSIMDVNNGEKSGYMFQIPLATALELCTVKDTARAFINGLNHLNQLEGKTFNLGGGKNCHVTYKQLLETTFDAYGLGKPNFPKFAFAKQNSHLGWYMDSNLLNDILNFQRESAEDYFKQLRESVPKTQRAITKILSGMVKKKMIKMSEPFKAYKNGDREKINYFFGES